MKHSQEPEPQPNIPASGKWPTLTPRPAGSKFPAIMKVFILGTILLLCLTPSQAQTDPCPNFQDLLNTANGKTVMQQIQPALNGSGRLRDELAFKYALAEVLTGLDGLAHDWYRYGLHSQLGNFVPFLRLPLPGNPQPEPVSNNDARTSLQNFADALKTAGDTLSTIPDSSDMRVTLNVAPLRTRFKDGPLETSTLSVLEIFRHFSHSGNGATNLVATFEVGDARWLEGYCHLLRAMLNTALAYDTQNLFDHTAHLFFAQPATPYPFLCDTNQRPGPDRENFTDAIAFIHLLNLPVKDPAKMQAALTDLRQTLDLSRRSWADITNSTTTTNKWIAGPNQSSVTGMTISPEMLKAWLQFIDESQQVLNGKKLAPFWRNAPGMGVNINKVFTDPKPFDLILWIQGTAAAPYLEPGEVTDKNFWHMLDGVFRGQFLFYAIWLN